MPRIRQEVDKLPLADAQKAIFISALFDRAKFLDTNGGTNTGQLTTDSSFFDFASKAQAVVDHFESDGLTLKKYLGAVLKSPHIIGLNPQTVTRNIDELVARFESDGLTRREYLKVALDEPALFYAAPERIASNVNGVVETFADDGLDTSDYLKAALKTQLFTYPSDFVASNIKGVVAHFASDGLDTHDYLKAALRLPPLFYSSPETVISNITQVVDRFAADGLTTREYLKSAVRQPSLFAMSPDTISRHIEAAMQLAEDGLFMPPKPRKIRTGPTKNPERALVIESLLKDPYLMCLADDNYALREVHQRMTEGPKDSRFLSRPRHRLEKELMAHFGHDDPKEPVPNDGFVAGQANPSEEQAKRFVLRALMHAGLIKGGSMER
ncbi:MAG: hypothetical protein CMK32_03410 [Porticoccaceae bacterium]|nr:hypothetical protein [Porticoccaceae bacterium]